MDTAKALPGAIEVVCGPLDNDADALLARIGENCVTTKLLLFADSHVTCQAGRMLCTILKLLSKFRSQQTEGISANVRQAISLCSPACC